MARTLSKTTKAVYSTGIFGAPDMQHAPATQLPRCRTVPSVRGADASDFPGPGSSPSGINLFNSAVAPLDEGARDVARAYPQSERSGQSESHRAAAAVAIEAGPS